MDPLSKVGLTDKDLDIKLTEYDIRTMHAFSPQEGRYAKYTEPLRKIVSEYEWVKRRLALEVEYLIGLGNEFQRYRGPRRRLIEQPFSDNQRKALKELYTGFSERDFVRFKRIEGETKHDVVAMTILALYNMGDIFDSDLMERAMHIGRTSADMDSNVFSLMAMDIMKEYYVPLIAGLQNLFIRKAGEWHNVPDDYPRPFTVIAAQTHEQPAVPTPLKKVVANIASAIDQGISKLVVGDVLSWPFTLYGKMGGAVGNDSAMMAAYPGHDWQSFYRKFIEGMGLEYQPACDQDESNMRFLELVGIIKRANLPLLKWADDYSSYLSRKILKKRTERQDRGSSIMPQKVNPWRTEGGESFLLMANAELEVLDLLARQRKQGDLRRNVLKRYLGIPMANIGIAIGRMHEDLENTYPNFDGIEKELQENPAIASASMQTILRASGVPKAYDMIVEKTKGRDVTPEVMEEAVSELVDGNIVDDRTGDDIRKIFIHERNMGDALERADDQLKEAEGTLGRLANAYDISL
jgi:adenylosuccinate lyase